MERNLDGIDLLGELSHSDRRELKSRCKWSKYAPDEVILSQDDEFVGRRKLDYQYRAGP